MSKPTTLAAIRLEPISPVGDAVFVSIDSGGNPGALNTSVLKQLGMQTDVLPGRDKLTDGYATIRRPDGGLLCFIVTIGASKTEDALSINLSSCLRSLRNTGVSRIWLPLMGTGTGRLTFESSLEATIQALWQSECLWNPRLEIAISPPITSDPLLLQRLNEQLSIKLKEAGSGFRFSQSGLAVLGRAAELAKTTKRAGITSSCLLFAFDARGESQFDTRAFVAQAFRRYRIRESGFPDFVESSSGGGWQSEFEIEGLNARGSSNTLSILRFAQFIAESVSKTSVIHARHLFAALLIGPDSGATIGARRRLQERGCDIGALLQEFRDFIRSRVGGDDQLRWDDILEIRYPAPSGEPPEPRSPRGTPPVARSSGFVSGPAAYNSEFMNVGVHGHLPDHLGVNELACRLGKLMALRETRMPLAIGLFGNWGSGKSHFMNLMDQHMKELAEKGGPWYRRIVPIYFNAWHYSDTNLWASLVTEIFDKLFAHLEPYKDELKTMQARLRDAGGATARAEQEAQEARHAVDHASAALDRARRDSNQAQQAMQGLMDGLKTLLPIVNTEGNRQRVLKWLGVEAELATLSQLRDKREELGSSAGKVKELWTRATVREGVVARIFWLAGAIVVVAFIGIVGPRLDLIKGILEWLSPMAKLGLGGLICAVGWVMPALKQIQEILSELAKWQRQAETAQAKLPQDPGVIEVQKSVVQAEARAVAAKNALSEAQAAEQQLRTAVDDLHPARRLSRFIEGRARSADYRGQLGLVSLARRDFQELTSIFADTEAFDRQAESVSKEDKQKLKKLSDTLDRVVLFVDDLDRCPPETVVDVLQAIHLLLAFRLFGVVVGVDQRWLKQSLRIQSRGLLTTDIEGNPRQDVGASSLGPEEIPATPLDYLEKIFHVPCQLPRMTPAGFANFVDKLTAPRAQPTPAPSVQTEEPPAETSAFSRPTALAEASPSIPVTGGPAAPTPAPPPSTKPVVDLVEVVGSVELERWERDALKEYASFVHTPRGATRLLNTYRLVRSGLPAQEWDTFRDDDGGKGESRLAMLLPAAAAGHPAVARDWFATLQGAAASDSIEWPLFKRAYDKLVSDKNFETSGDLLETWIHRVERFAF